MELGSDGATWTQCVDGSGDAELDHQQLDIRCGIDGDVWRTSQRCSNGQCVCECDWSRTRKLCRRQQFARTHWMEWSRKHNVDELDMSADEDGTDGKRSDEERSRCCSECCRTIIIIIDIAERNQNAVHNHDARSDEHRHAICASIVVAIEHRTDWIAIGHDRCSRIRTTRRQLPNTDRIE